MTPVYNDEGALRFFFKEKSLKIQDIEEVK